MRAKKHIQRIPREVSEYGARGARSDEEPRILSLGVEEVQGRGRRRASGGGAGGGCLCDPPLARSERVQWKIVPTANPWQANYSFDPPGVCIAVGGEGGDRLRRFTTVMGNHWL